MNRVRGNNDEVKARFLHCVHYITALGMIIEALGFLSTFSQAKLIVWCSGVI